MLGDKTTSTFTLPTHPVWAFDPRLEAEAGGKPEVTTLGGEEIKDEKEAPPFLLLPATKVDIQRVREVYDPHPMDGYDIASIEVIDNPGLSGAFEHYLSVLNTRVSNPKFQPTWQARCQGKQAELVHRESVISLYQQLSAPHQSSHYPYVHLLPAWHGTYDTVANHIFKGGYGIFTSLENLTDEGFFGRGIYSTVEAEYGYRCYAQKHGNDAVLILNWMSFYTAYPVIDGDMWRIKGKMGGFYQCDANFVPVRSDAHPNTDVYLPCRSGQMHQSIEVVVFNEAQCLPRYRVKLKKHRIDKSLTHPFEASYEKALKALCEYDYARIQSLFEKVIEKGNIAAQVRLHWLASDGCDRVLTQITPEQQQALTTHVTEKLPSLSTYISPMMLNHPEAQFLAAWCYLNGLGVKQDAAQAAEHYWLAAEKGHSEAQYQLAQCCSIGQGVEKDFKQAVAYYDKAAKTKHPQACYALVVIYTMGLGGIAPDLALALPYTAVTQAAGYPNRLANPEGNYQQGLAYETAKHYQAAAIEYHKAMEAGHTKARTNLGRFFLSERGGCAKDTTKAYQCYYQSAQEGHAKAMQNVSVLFKKGVGVEKDMKAAQHWASLAKGSMTPS